MYEYLITADDEIMHIWYDKAGGQKRRASTILFGLTRYLTLLYAVIAAIANLLPGVSACIIRTGHSLISSNSTAVRDNRLRLGNAVQDSPIILACRNCLAVGRLDETLAISLSVLLGGGLYAI